MRLHPESLAAHAVAGPGELGPEVVPPEAWITSNAYERQLEVTEQSWLIQDYNSVLTLLVVVDADGAEEYDLVRHYEKKAQRSV